ncbi:methyltransferase family protein [Litorimonas sp. RW-G-Af-16]|uniref:methyltransferase family protein n=1 Tax=Litorimonas sp. RW-G-Af-16 TaxID=3241168 RepID=UPI00390CB8D3
MTNKIPPPILTILTMAAVWGVSRLSLLPTKSLPYQSYIGLSVSVLGLIILLISGMGFKRAKTTVNPFRPQSTSSIVDTGIYAISRNPMYLAMAVVILGYVIGLGQILGLLPLLAFILYITAFQIKPEERALTEKFGAAYTDYKSRVRRWI